MDRNTPERMTPALSLLIGALLLALVWVTLEWRQAEADGMRAVQIARHAQGVASQCHSLISGLSDAARSQETTP